MSNRSYVESEGGFLKQSQRPHWYEITIQTCPVCGGGTTFRERHYGPKPSDPMQVFHYEEIYDWCNER